MQDQSSLTEEELDIFHQQSGDGLWNITLGLTSSLLTYEKKISSMNYYMRI